MKEDLKNKRPPQVYNQSGEVDLWMVRGTLGKSTTQKHGLSIVFVFYCIDKRVYLNRLKAPHGDESFEACCQ